MAAGGAASPPTEAMRRGVSRGLFLATVVIVAVIMLGAGVFVGKALYGGSSSTSSKFLVVGTNIPFPPFEDYNYSSGTYFGFDINFSMLIAAQLHRTLVIDNYDNWDALLADIGKGVVDMGASAITESGHVGYLRNASMTFSEPYYEANQALLVRSSNTLVCPTSSGCTVHNMSSMKLGVQAGTSSDIWSAAYLVPNETGGSVTGFADVPTEIAALTSGALDGVIIDYNIAMAYETNSSGALKIAGPIYTHEFYGFAVAHDDPEGLIPSINFVINQAKQNGTYQKLLSEWGLG
jgi:polar amino acid transport system substrate-binding protein